MDAVYMEAVQAIAGSGGWPMSVFLTPDRRPFYGGTYFPPVDRQGTPAFRTVLATLADAWADRRSDVEEQADELCRVIESRTSLPAPTTRRTLVDESGATGEAPDVLAAAVEDLASRFDPAWGGFSPAPKFPQPTLVDLLLLDAAAWRGDLGGLGGDGGAHPRRDGRRRDPRPPRWRVRPVFHRRRVAGAPLREDALRPGRSAALLPARMAGHRTRRLPVGGRGDRAVRGAATSPSRAGACARPRMPTPRDGRGPSPSGPPASSPPHSPPGASPPRRPRRSPRSSASRDTPNFEGRFVLRRPVGEPLTGAEAVETGRHLLEAARDATGPPRPRRQGAHRVERDVRLGAGRGRGRHRRGGVDRRGDRDRRVPLRPPAPADGRWLRSWQENRGGRHLAYAGDYAWLVDCFTRLGELTGRRALDRTRHSRPPTRCSISSVTPRREASSPPVATRSD